VQVNIIDGANGASRGPAAFRKPIAIAARSFDLPSERYAS